MKEFKHPSFEAILAIHQQVTAAHGGADGIQSRDLLDSVIAAPQASFGGQPVITDGVEIAASYLFYLCRNHPFVDGDKRVALATCLVFLQSNELYRVGRLDVDAWEALTLDGAASRIDRIETALRLKQWIESDPTA